MPITGNNKQLREELQRRVAGAKSREEMMAEVAALLHQRMLKYNWVGFYMLEPQGGDKSSVLVLGPFEGAMTPHTRIPLHQGICGAAASSGTTVVVDDVSTDPRYLACSLETKSEIVVPIFVRGQVAGELNVDSHFPAAFQDEDRELLEYTATIVGKQLEARDA
jgi:L-methionine (R)-S-oxide reductase